IVSVGNAENAYVVDTGNAVTRMREPGGEVAVVGQQQQPFRIEVEAADRIDVLVHAVQQVENRRAPLWIGPGGHVAPRLVEQNIPVALRRADTPAGNPDVVMSGIGLPAELPDAPDGHSDAPPQPHATALS